MIYRLQKKMILICGGALLLVFSVLFLMIALAGKRQLNTAMDSFIAVSYTHLTLPTILRV